MLDPQVEDEQRDKVASDAKAKLEAAGEIKHEGTWGTRKMAYEIDKKPEGIYHLLEFSCAPETLDEVSRVLKIDDGVMRHLATRRRQRGPGQPVAVGGPPKDDVGLVPDSSLEEEE